MDRPVCDFIKNYIQKDSLRLHMPGHKGNGFLGFEQYDITEIMGADSLYEPEGIIKKSEQNASRIFGAQTFYSTEGSSQCIRAMLYLAMLKADRKNKPYVIAGRNAHKSFLSACALLDFDIKWIYGKSYLSCKICPDELDKMLECDEKPFAVYITSPDYLGNISDIKSISVVCKKHNVMLLVDNAHGAYLKFLDKSLHPIDLGADMCSDSAHKTLPVLTGGAYLHTSAEFSAIEVKQAMALFGSTSPSYLILQSLDAANEYLKNYKLKLEVFLPQMSDFKNYLLEKGFKLQLQEPLKITIMPKSYGYTGTELAQILRNKDIECEFSDPDFLVMMFTPEINKDGFEKLKKTFGEIEKREAIEIMAPEITIKERKMSVRDACFSLCEECDATKSAGRVLAHASVGCPPAVPVVISGEMIDEKDVECFKYYGIEKVMVLK